MTFASRRDFLRRLGVSAASLPLLMNLPSLGLAQTGAKRQRLLFVFSPNGTIPTRYWPDALGEDFDLKEILTPLAEFKDQLLILKGISNRVRGDGDSHMRGMSCLLTGIDLFPGNIQGGSHTPAGWASGLSIDQEIKAHLQARDETRTRFGSLEFGVMVPDRADPWTRWVYSGPNKPVAPIDNPYRMFEKMYGRLDDQESLQSILDDVQEDLAKVRPLVSSEDRRLLEEHQALVRDMERELAALGEQQMDTPPELEPGVRQENDNLPQLTKMQIDLLVHGMQQDMARLATFQFTNSVGQARMRWLGVDEGHHALSHDPDSNKESQEKLTKINKWFCEQLAYLARKLAATPESDGSGSLLDNTTIVWTNELGKGNSHTLDNVPFLLLGKGLGFKTGRALQFKNVPHNRLLMSFAHAMGHPVKTFGNPDLCGDGVLSELT